MPPNPRMRVVYVTSAFPHGANEPFLGPEIEELERRGCEVVVVPTRARGPVLHDDASARVSRMRGAPLFSRAIVDGALEEAWGSRARAARAVRLLGRSRTPPILAKNAAVVPKALWLARYARAAGAAHIHAHWASTSSTLAMLASEISGISWSLTAHRWDIVENNLLATKARSACFVRVISEHGAGELRALVGDTGWRPWVLHMGVRLPADRRRAEPPEPPLRVLVAARFVEKKGHVHLVDAVARLKERGIAVQVDLAGDGPLEPEIRRLVAERRLADDVRFLGTVPHARLVEELGGRRWHVSVVPSVVTPTGELEGIPVSLIEAMAVGVPTVGTETGGIPELLGGGAGLLVPPGDPKALADALGGLAGDPARWAELADRGRARVEEAFSVEAVGEALVARFEECARVA